MAKGHRTPAPQPKKSASSAKVVNGWTLFFWSEFRARWNEMQDTVRRLRKSDPAGYSSSAQAKFFRTVRDLVFEEIPLDPDSAEYRQWVTLGREHTGWRRARFHRRFRLFFRFDSRSKTIIYVWINDENTLRKAGSRSDPYAVFAGMLNRGKPPSDWDALLAECELDAKKDK